MTTPEWDLYRSFLAVVDTGSLSGAARALGLSQPTVGRHIESLEAALDGAVLFTRSPGGLAPTEAALALRPHVEAMASAAEALLRTASGEAAGERGVVRVTASEIVGAEVLPPILAEFHEAHPGVTVELALNNQQEDLLRRDADIAVRMARPTQGALLARRVGSVKLGLYAHRRYLQKHGEPRGFDEAGHSAVGFDRDTQTLRALKDLNLPLRREMFAFRSDSDLAQLAAVRAGFGIGACQVTIARRDPNLVPVLREVFDYDMEIWVAMHEDLKASRRMRLMFDALVAGLQAYVAEGA
ncbi:MAG: LysR family transcriptional regulator [Caulobacterales bacterium]